MLYLCASLLVASVLASEPACPTPTPRQLQFQEGRDPVVGGLSMFMHYGLPSYWVEGDTLLPNQTYHDCKTAGGSFCTEKSCGSFAPCLAPDLFQYNGNPVEVDAEQWMQVAKAAGFQEITLTAQHEGGFALWPSKYTNYSVAAAPGAPNVLQAFVTAARKYDIGIAYYLNVQCNHHFTENLKLSGAEFLEREMGMLTEVLRDYGPVNRMWFDGTRDFPKDLDRKTIWAATLKTIRTVSPNTLITSYRDYGGDIQSSWLTQHRYEQGPKPNSTDMTNYADPSITGQYFAALEQIGVNMQEGPDGDSNVKPTYWFWHPMVGQASPQRLFHDYMNTTGHGTTLMINVPAARNGSIPSTMQATLTTLGSAIRNTFGTSEAEMGAASGSCSTPIVLDTSAAGAFDYIMTKEDLSQGQRIWNYTIEYQTASGSWATLVPPVTNPSPPLSSDEPILGDRPAGTDQRSAQVGVRRIDLPVIDVSSTASIPAIRFVCLQSSPDTIYLKSLSVHKKDLPWEE